ncbi:phosphatidylserine decarboxylase [Helicobacter sp. 11S03491-1]|uniref:phosphatidylserine decarboxylase n=1 Tax=Helicobacter sp. 11S03491-1 TaxID=1476196 RepID=UPI000BA6B8B6|nr:phosphatidylserine decarboxylase [Helicobacter sp. 11S03491-1]PAF42734.1 phosphatidylserine decarboxylase [Helicobacter sp. 11S03491-1]
MMGITNSVSRYFGRFANYEFPRAIQKVINSIYVKIFDIDLNEFDSLQSYKSLNALFTRSLKVSRKFDTSEECLISPCDCLITQYAQVQENRALQIKGMAYSVAALLGLKQDLQEGYSYLNFYLSPKDYHHYHAPCDMEILEVRYFAGKLLSVNQPSLKKNTDLFIQNERVVVVGRDKKGEMMYYVAVGALNVGQMVLHFEPKIQTNKIANQNIVYVYSNPILISKGEELGLFKMGSTIVLFMKDIKITALKENSVKFGDTIGIFV